MRQTHPHTVTVPMAIGFGAASLASSIFGTAPQVLLLFYMTEILAIPVAWAGTAIFIPKIWEWVIDPIVGSISDSYKGSIGRRRPFLLMGALAFGCTFPALFACPPYESDIARLAWVLVAFIASTTAYSIFFVPYLAMPAEMTEEAPKRTLLMATRIGFVCLGILLTGAGGPLLVKVFGGGPDGYRAMGGLLTVIACSSLITTYLSTRKAAFAPPNSDRLTLRQKLGIAISNRPFVLLLATYMLQCFAMAAFAAGLPYLVKYILGREQSYSGLIFLCVMGTAILSMPVWALVARRIGRRAAYLCGTSIYILTCGACWWQPMGDLSLAFFILMGIGFGGVQLFSHALLPDAMTANAPAAGGRREGLFSAFWVIGEKSAFAIGALTVGLMLHAFGFASASGGVAEQTDHALVGMRISISILLAASLATSFVLIAASSLGSHEVRSAE